MSSRIEREMRVVVQMIRIYCKSHHGDELCGDCKDLLEYAHARLSNCPHGEGKKSCKLCAIHCYAPEYKERIRIVMRYVGPRMIKYHPVSAIRHLWDELKR